MALSGLFLYHLVMHNLESWIERITANASWRTIADRMGTTHPTIQRRLKNETASAVVAIARAYDANPIEGLLTAGVISENDLEGFEKPIALSDFTDMEIAQELVNRIAERGEDSEIATVTDFPTPYTPPNVRGGLYAADDSPDEPEMGDDGFNET